jgi:hypothetical protein
MALSFMHRRDFLRAISLIGACTALSYGDSKFLRNLPSCSGFTDNISSIESLISRFNYGQFNILKEHLTIVHDPENSMVLFYPFYHYDKPDSYGTCTELMHFAASDLVKAFPGYHILQAGGTEPDFFFCKRTNTKQFEGESSHYFLLMVEENKMEEGDYTTNTSEISQILAQETILVDPSFKRVVPFKSSGYLVDALQNPSASKTGWNVSNELFFSTSGDFGVPLCFLNDGRLALLSAHSNLESLVTIGLQKKGQLFTHHDLFSSYITSQAKNDNMLGRFVDLLRSTEIERGTI